MKYHLKYEIHGAQTQSDETVYELQLPTLNTEALMPVMGWKNESDSLGSYFLTPCQTVAIEGLLNAGLPRNLGLYLTATLESERADDFAGCNHPGRRID